MVGGSVSSSYHFAAKMAAVRIQVTCFRDDFGFGRAGRKAVGGQHGAVVRLVRGAEVGRHRERVVALSYAFSLSCQ